MTSPVIATVEEGKLLGKISQDYFGADFYSFQGIPYAKSPIGDLRFKAPVPAEPWEGIRNATKEGNQCPGIHMILGNCIGSEEECLNLNVYTKELPNEHLKNSLKPVMVWIHGGAFLCGSNTTDFYGPQYLLTEDIVLVTINYRLGILGFLCLDDSTLGVPGNAGMKDMVLALKWVQKNIHNFIGDPSNVTIFGESAGGVSVHCLMLSPLAEGLFHKAIVQSSCILNPWVMSKSNANIIAESLNYELNNEKDFLEYLRKLPIKTLIKTQHKCCNNRAPSIVNVIGPVVEKISNEPAFLLEDPLDLIRKGAFHKIPLIIGYNSNEGLLFSIQRKKKRYPIVTDFETEIPHQLQVEKGSEKSIEFARKIKDFYFGNEEPSENNIHKLYSLKSDQQFVHGIHRTINHKKNHTTAPIYFYKMSLVTSLNFVKRFETVKSTYIANVCYLFSYLFKNYGSVKNQFIKVLNSLPVKNIPGVCHADELSYLFNTFLSPNISPGSLEDVSIRRFVNLWTNFARTGNPTPNSLNPLIEIEWKPVQKDELCYLDIGETLKMDTNPDVEGVQFWNSLFIQQNCL